MLGERCSNYRIIRIFNNRLIIKKLNDGSKFVYREYNQPPNQNTVALLESLKRIRHPSILNVEEVIKNQGQVGVFYEFFTNDLETVLAKPIIELDQQSLLNTLQPIRQAIEHYHKIEQCVIRVTPKSIVMTESGDVKLAHNILIDDTFDSTVNPRAKLNNLQQLLEIALTLAETNKPETSKSIKIRLKRLKSRLNQTTFNFLGQLYNSAYPMNVGKTKRIQKCHSINNENRERCNPRTKLMRRDSKVAIEMQQTQIPIRPLN